MNCMRLLHVINGWTDAPHCWRHFLRRPLRVQREPVLILDEAGELAIREAPAVYSVQVLGVVLFLEVGKGLRA